MIFPINVSLSFLLPSGHFMISPSVVPISYHNVPIAVNNFCYISKNIFSVKIYPFVILHSDYAASVVIIFHSFPAFFHQISVDVIKVFHRPGLGFADSLTLTVISERHSVITSHLTAFRPFCIIDITAQLIKSGYIFYISILQFFICYFFV